MFDSNFRYRWLQTLFMYYRLSFRHRNSWQDAGRIKLHRADLIRFIYELSVELRVHYETPPPRRLLYHGGSLSHGEVIDFKRNILSRGNVKNHALENDVHSATDDPSLLYLNQNQKLLKLQRLQILQNLLMVLLPFHLSLFIIKLLVSKLMLPD